MEDHRDPPQLLDFAPPEGCTEHTEAKEEMVPPATVASPPPVAMGRPQTGQLLFLSSDNSGDSIRPLLVNGRTLNAGRIGDNVALADRLHASMDGMREGNTHGEHLVQERPNTQPVAVSLAQRRASRSTFLRPMTGVRLEDLPLDRDADFQQLEAERERLRSLPGDHRPEIQAVEEALNRRTFALAKERGLLPEDAAYLTVADPRGERAAYLRPIPGVNLHDLPLDVDAEFQALEEERTRLVALPGDHTAETKAVEEALSRRAMGIAAERGLLPATAAPSSDGQREAARRKYLRCLPGIDLKTVPLSEDHAFQQLESERDALLKLTGDHAAELKSLEEAMNFRVFQMVKERALLHADEPYYPAEIRAKERSEHLLPIIGVDLAALPVDQDESFQFLEKERARLVSVPGGNLNDISRLDEALNRRAWVLAQELGLLPADAQYTDDTDLCTRPRRRLRVVKDALGENTGYAYEHIPDPLTLMDPFMHGIPLAHLRDYLDADGEFHQLLERYDNAATQDETGDVISAMNRRACAFADVVHDVELVELPSTVDGMPVNTLDLHGDEALTELENEARELRMQPETADPGRLEALEAQIVERLHHVAKRSREPYLTEEMIGAPLELLDLANFPSFLTKEKELHRLMKNPTATKTPLPT
ncbi:calpain-like cysteine peptidase [Strigomonas culicis]|uniref:Calpain-like cysteine peptidase n=1 Tax=Strigomonas culicis TaxID=28005 RepID=S9TK73_9TRYP|nr:calpain-like cysteine peptidase [Strigomonas culicis]|eukprot:EPY17229.1 calpain-like cysteine peptidase [Strigomonas culicis]